MDTSLRGYLYEQRGIKTARQIADEFGLSLNAVEKVWTRERLRRGDPKIAGKKPTYDPQYRAAIYALWGQLPAKEAGELYGLTGRVIRGIWSRERAKRGDPPPPGVRVLGDGRRAPVVIKHPRETIDAIYAEYGKTRAADVCVRFGVTRCAVIGIWRRERIRRGEALKDPPPRVWRPRATKQAVSKVRSARIFNKARREATFTTKTVVNRAVPKKKINRFGHLFGPSGAYEASFMVRDVDANPANGGQGYTFLELPHSGCRFPLGDWSGPAEFFCGADRMVGQSYCTSHYALCYRPAREAA